MTGENHGGRVGRMVWGRGAVVLIASFKLLLLTSACLSPQPECAAWGMCLRYQ